MDQTNAHGFLHPQHQKYIKETSNFQAWFPRYPDAKLHYMRHAMEKQTNKHPVDKKKNPCLTFTILSAYFITIETAKPLHERNINKFSVQWCKREKSRKTFFSI